jgi:exonuclease SbcC
VNVICGESDNGKSAVIRAIRWVMDNYPSGTDSINSSWNENFKEPLSVRIYTEKGWVEKIRTKTRNGYTICKGENEPVELSAVGRTVPKEVTEFFNLSDVNFQYQLDPPYLLSMTPGQASQYLNEIVHLDSIDKIMSIADSDKRQLSSEQKTVESDIKKFTEQLEELSWVDEANNIYKRAEHLDKLVSAANNNITGLTEDITRFEEYSNQIVDLSEHKKLIEQIESVTLYDTEELENSINSYQAYGSQIVDTSKAQKLINHIDSNILTDITELESSILQFEKSINFISELDKEIETLNRQMPERCPYCNSLLKEHECL